MAPTSSVQPITLGDSRALRSPTASGVVPRRAPVVQRAIRAGSHRTDASAGANVVGMIILKHGDIARESADAIVTAANPQLRGGGGVDRAIHLAAGASVMQELHELRSRHGPCPPGHAVVTKAGQLAARWIIHAVGPVWRGGEHGEVEALRSAYTSALVLAEKLGVRSVCFPSLSTGAYGFPVEAAAPIALRALREGVRGCRNVTEVRIVLWTPLNLATFAAALHAIEREA